jgi:hypothetical protein
MDPNLQSISGVDDRSCTAPAEVQEEEEEDRHSGFYFNTHISTLFAYYLDTNLWRAPPLASMHLMCFLGSVGDYL